MARRLMSPGRGAREHHAHAGGPGLKAARTAQGVTLEALAELTGYPGDYLRRMEDEGLTAPRIVTSRISAVLGVTTDAVRGDQAGQITRVADVLPETRKEG